MLDLIGGVVFLYLCLKTNHRVGLLPQNSGTFKLSLSLLYSKAYKIIKKSAEMNVLIRLCFILMIGFFSAKNYFCYRKKIIIISIIRRYYGIRFK
ncbi:hypothetical protein AB991_04240 [Helicobacter pylori]|nr:hypothetical protein AB991_04240 [Helicobacter pylori]